MARLLYRPFGLILGLLAGQVAKVLLGKLWGAADKDSEGHAPHSARRDISTRKAVASAAVQAATFAGTKAVVDRAGYRAFEHLTGASPRPKEAIEQERSSVG